MIDLYHATDDQILGVAIPIMDNLMEGGTQRDWEKHTKHFTPMAKQNLTNADLQRQCDAYQASHGNFMERKFAAITKHPDYVNILFKQKMSKVPGEYLAVLTLVQAGNQYQVIRCWVDLWEANG